MRILKLWFKKHWQPREHDTEQIVVKKRDTKMAEMIKALSSKNLEKIRRAACELYFCCHDSFSHPNLWGNKKLLRQAISLLQQSAKAVKGSEHEYLCTAYSKLFRGRIEVCVRSRRKLDSLLVPNSQ